MKNVRLESIIHFPIRHAQFHLKIHSNGIMLVVVFYF